MSVLDTKQTEEHHTSHAKPKIGIILCALGTPDAPTTKATRKYLKEFLSDPRVIEFPRLLWLPILYGPILTFRSRRSAEAYKAIWDFDRGESPLRTITRGQADALGERLHADELVVTWAFRYGNPSIGDALKELSDRGVGRVLFFPLYPQYSATTVASAQDKLFDELRKMRWQPTVRTITSYFEDAVYIDRLARQIKSELSNLNWSADLLLASYHSIPQAYWEKGDPYPCQCFKTSRLLKEALELDDERFVTSFQSRVGPSKWVGPYTDDTVRDLAKKGVKKLVVFAPAFSADCLETLEELNIELRETFLSAGGTHFHYIPCLNDSVGGVDVFEHVIRKELQGWL